MTRARIVVITGASSGVGRATAHAFAKEGASIALLARNEKALHCAKEEVERLGGKGWVLPVDVSDQRAVETAANRIEKELGPIDVWVNNAMVSVVAPFHEITPEEYIRITNVTYLGYVWGTLAAVKRMRDRNRGVIIQVGSALAHRSIPLQSAYCGAKHAIVGFTESLRCELLHDRKNVQVSLVHLPGVNTPQFNWAKNHLKYTSKPVGTIYQPELAGKAIVFASRHPRKEILLGMPTVESLLGQKIAASALDRYLAKKVYAEHFTNKRERPDRPNNLFHPIDTDYGTHGPYDSLATSRSYQFWVTRNRKWIVLGAAILGAVLLRATRRTS